MEVMVIDHPLVADRLTKIRQTATTNAVFRQNLHEASLFLIYEALQNIGLTETPVETPLAQTKGHTVIEQPIFVPILRAGLGMLDAALVLCPESCVAFVGAKRDENTLQPDIYLNTIPDNLNGSMVVLLDPALATGGSMIHALELAESAGAGEMIVVTLLASPEGIQALSERGLGTKVVTAAIDEKLNDIGFIYPGLGDAGDRQYGIN